MLLHWANLVCFPVSKAFFPKYKNASLNPARNKNKLPKKQILSFNKSQEPALLRKINLFWLKENYPCLKLIRTKIFNKTARLI